MVTLYLTGNTANMPQDATPIRCDVYKVCIEENAKDILCHLWASHGVQVLN